MRQRITAGVDIGSLTADAVVLSDHAVLAYSVVPTMADSEAAGIESYRSALDLAGLAKGDVSAIIATGYGRGTAAFADKTVTEITCHAVGARHLVVQARTVIDIGGQDSKVIRLAHDGRVEDFAMNDKCAAGTGRFLDVMAKSLDTDLDSLAALASESARDVRISSTCTVFAESEVVALVAKGVRKEDIIRGLHRSVAERIYAMVVRLRACPPFVMTGGVAKNAGVASALEERLGESVLVPDEPQIVGALGAAILARAGCEK